MTQRVWDEFLTGRDKEVLRRSGYGADQGFGKRPALLIVDVNYGFCGDVREPILRSIETWPNSCGEDAYAALPFIANLRDKAHEKGIPVLYTTGAVRDDHWDSGSWNWKNRRAHARPRPELDNDMIHPDIAPAPQDIVCRKQKPSAFFGTNLAAYLVLLGCDSLVVTGTTTSGCVRATVTDAFSLNYRVTLAEEGCFDRCQASHAINLSDMHAKYADVVACRDVLEYFDRLPAGMYDLPGGRGRA